MKCRCQILIALDLTHGKQYTKEQCAKFIGVCKATVYNAWQWRGWLPRRLSRYMIIGEIKKFLRNNGIIKVLRLMKKMATTVCYTTELLTAKLGRQPTNNKFANEIGVGMEELIVAREAGHDVEALHATIYQGDGSPIFLIDKVA